MPFLAGFGRFVRLLLPLTATVLFLGVAWFDLGADLNVPSLFWSESWREQFLAGFSSCLLLGYVWLLDALVDNRLNPAPAGAVAVAAGWSHSPGHWLLLVVGLAVSGWRFVGGEAASGVADLLACGLLVLWVLAPAGTRGVLQRPVPPLPFAWWPAVREYLANTWVPLGVLLILPAVIHPISRLWEPLGVVAGFALVWATAGVIRLGHRRQARRAAAAGAPLPGLSGHAAELLAGFLFVSLIVIYFVLMEQPKDRVPPALSVATLFGLLSGLHAAVWFYGRRWVPVVALVLAGWYLYCNGRPYKLHFPNLGAAYASPLPLADDEEPELADQDRERLLRLCARLHQRLEDRPAADCEQDLRDRFPRLDPRELAQEYDQVLAQMEAKESLALRHWRDSVARRTNAPRPIVVVVATSGGANRSALWTAVVLDKLEAELRDAAAPASHFPKHVRLIAGASGGMVGAAHFVGSLGEDGHGGVFDPEAVASDSLTPVLNATVFHEVPLMVVPIHSYDRDRGQILEAEFEKVTGQLGRPFADLEPGERAGWRPSLVFTPMLVEDGRRLIVSNLMLPHQTTSRGSLLLGAQPAPAAPTPAKPSSAFPSAPMRQSRLADGTGPAGFRPNQSADADPATQRLDPEREVYSRSAVELFRLFPEARRTLHVSTAARMNASFPYVSPAVELPTTPIRSVVDAGYYDNFGVNVAARWIEHHREWLADNVGGVLLIQIRDSRSEVRRSHLVFDEDEPPTGLARRVHESLTWLTGPPSGAAAARDSVTSFRNDEQVQALDNFFRARRPADPVPFFTTVVFERPGTVGMNWYLSPHDKAIIRDGFNPALANNPNPQKLDRLKAWWHAPRPGR